MNYNLVTLNFIVFVILLNSVIILNFINLIIILNFISLVIILNFISFVIILNFISFVIILNFINLVNSIEIVFLANKDLVSLDFIVTIIQNYINLVILNLIIHVINQIILGYPLLFIQIICLFRFNYSVDCPNIPFHFQDYQYLACTHPYHPDSVNFTFTLLVSNRYLEFTFRILAQNYHH